MVSFFQQTQQLWQRFRPTRADVAPRTPPQRVLIISASVGGGHVSAGRALETACQTQGLEYKHIDLLSYTNTAVRRLYRDSYFEMVELAPDLVNWVGKRLDVAQERKGRLARSLDRFGRLLVRRLPRDIRHYQPDVILHTHFWSPAVLATMGKNSIPEGVIITDFGAHGLWLKQQIGRYFVASEDIAAHMQASGISKQRLAITGIPIDPRFAALLSQEEARAQLKLSQNKDVVLLMATGLRPAILEKLIAQLIGIDYPLSVEVICGRSEANLHIAQQAWEKRSPNCHIELHIHGFTSEMPHYMAAADVIIGKPGGLTSSEAVAAGVAFAVVSPYPLQEEANANFLLENGLGFRIDPLTILNSKLKSYLSQPAKRHELYIRSRSMARANAAEQVVHSLLASPISRIPANQRNLNPKK